MSFKQSFVTGLTDVYPTNSGLPNSGAREPLGTIRYGNTNVYKYVQFSGTTTVAAGDPVCYVAFASDGLLQIVDDANTAFGAGVAMAAVASGTVQYGWIQIRGLAKLSNAPTGGPTIGQPLTTQGSTAAHVALVSAATQQTCGYFYGTGNYMACTFPN